MPEGMQQENRQQYRSSRQLAEFWKHIKFCGNPEHQSAEHEIDREYIHESPRSLSACRKSTAPRVSTGDVAECSHSLARIVTIGDACMNQPLTVVFTTPNDKIFPSGGSVGTIRLSNKATVRGVRQGGVVKLFDAVRLNPPVAQSCILQLTKKSRQLVRVDTQSSMNDFSRTSA